MNAMPATALIARALAVAERIIGLDELCNRLRVPRDSVRAWKAGEEGMPEHTFLRLVEILVDLDANWTEWDNSESKPKP